MAKTKNRKDRLPTVDLRWIPTQAKCVVCGKTLELLGPFDSFFGGRKRLDGTLADDYQVWPSPYAAGEVHACASCVKPEGFVLRYEDGNRYRFPFGGGMPQWEV